MIRCKVLLDIPPETRLHEVEVRLVRDCEIAVVDPLSGKNVDSQQRFIKSVFSVRKSWPSGHRQGFFQECTFYNLENINVRFPFRKMRESFQMCFLPFPIDQKKFEHSLESAENSCIDCVVAHGALLHIRAKNSFVVDQFEANYRQAETTPRQSGMPGLQMKISGTLL